MFTRRVDLKRLRSIRGCAPTALAVLLGGIACFALADPTSPSEFLGWPMFGQNLANTASGITWAIAPGNVGNLVPRWVFTTQGDVSARAAVVSGSVFFPDFAGNLYRLNAKTGALVWSKSLGTDYGLVPPSGSTKVVSRTSPAVHGDTLYIGNQATGSGAYLLAIDTRDGSLKWKTQVDGHPLAIETSSPVVFEDVVYAGVASLEESASANPQYPCCTFRGSAIAISAKTGAVIWKHYTAPEFSSCVADRQLTDEVVTDCLSPDDLVDSVAALDMKSGALRWSHRMWTEDDWNVACLVGFASGPGNCPNPQGPDFDFASGANLFVTLTAHGPKAVLGAGQKSGRYTALDPDTGKLLWSTAVGPGSALGGMEWGSATDGERIYVAIGNLYGLSYAVGSAGSWSARDSATGKILWQTPDPNGSLALAPMTVANGVLYAASMAGSPQAQNMLALNARTGEILWRFAAGGSVIAGARSSRTRSTGDPATRTSAFPALQPTTSSTPLACVTDTTLRA